MLVIAEVALDTRVANDIDLEVENLILTVSSPIDHFVIELANEVLVSLASAIAHSCSTRFQRMT